MATTINIWIVSIEEYLSNRPLPDCSQKHCGGNKLIANNNQQALCIVAKLMNESDLVYELLACEIFVGTPSCLSRLSCDFLSAGDPCSIETSSEC